MLSGTLLGFTISGDRATSEAQDTALPHKKRPLCNCYRYSYCKTKAHANATESLIISGTRISQSDWLLYNSYGTKHMTAGSTCFIDYSYEFIVLVTFLVDLYVFIEDWFDFLVSIDA